MSSIFGLNVKLSLFGESHGPFLGVTLDGFPPGVPFERHFVEDELRMRHASRYRHATKRVEPDAFQLLSGVTDGYTNGAPICAIFENKNARRSDYDFIQDIPRPSHADYPASVRYGGFFDLSGGGHLSGRMTLPLVFAGALCKLALRQSGVQVHARIVSIGTVFDRTPNGSASPADWEGMMAQNALPVLSKSACEEMLCALEEALQDGDSLGGTVECAVLNLPAGVGEPFFFGVEQHLSSILFSIPGVKGVEFGDGFALSSLRGSEANDCYVLDGGEVKTTTNHQGGITGGISNGMPVVFRAAFKPTPSIAKMQQTLNFKTGQTQPLRIQGRHDACIALRGLPAVSAAAAIALFDLLCPPAP